MKKTNIQGSDPGGWVWNPFITGDQVSAQEMLPIVDKPAVQYVVREAIDSGVESILFVTGRGKEPLKIILIMPWNWNWNWKTREI